MPINRTLLEKKVKQVLVKDKPYTKTIAKELLAIAVCTPTSSNAIEASETILSRENQPPKEWSMRVIFHDDSYTLMTGETLVNYCKALTKTIKPLKDKIASEIVKDTFPKLESTRVNKRESDDDDDVLESMFAE